MHTQCRTLATSVIWETRIMKNDSVTDKKITAGCNNNYYNYYTEIIILLYMCVCVTTYIPSPTKSA